MIVSIYIPTNSVGRFPFYTSSPKFIVCRVFDDSHSDWCEVISHCNFDMHFSHNDWCWESFHVFVGHLYVFFEEMSFKSSTHFFDWVVCFFILSCLYILEINPLSVAPFANIFSHSEGCVFILFMVSFAVQKLLSLIRSHLFIFIYIFITLGGGSERSCCCLCQRMFFLFSSEEF